MKLESAFLYFGGYGKILQYSTFDNAKPIKYYVCEENSIKKILVVDKLIWFLSEKYIGIIQTKYFHRFADIKYLDIISSMATSATLDRNRKLVYVGTEGKGVFLFKDTNLSNPSQCFLRDTCMSGRNHTKKSIEDNENLFNLGIGRRFTIKWRFDKNPDQVLIFEGKKLIYNSKNSPKPKNPRKWELSTEMVTSQPTIKVVVKSNKKKRTVWDYCIQCIN